MSAKDECTANVCYCGKKPPCNSSRRAVVSAKLPETLDYNSMVKSCTLPYEITAEIVRRWNSYREPSAGAKDEAREILDRIHRYDPLEDETLLRADADTIIAAALDEKDKLIEQAEARGRLQAPEMRALLEARAEEARQEMKKRRKAREVWLHPRNNEYRPMWWFCRDAVTPVEVCYQLMHPKTAVLFREVLPRPRQEERS